MTSHDGAEQLPEGVLACSLAGADRADRQRWLERLRQRSLGVVSRPDGVTVRFVASDETEAEVRELAAAEGQCCAFLALEVIRDGHIIELSVSGPPDARPIIDEMFKA